MTLTIVFTDIIIIKKCEPLFQIKAFFFGRIFG